MRNESPKPLDEFDWRVDFEGLLHLLAKNLYTQTDVLVRELLQNAHDAIVFRAEMDDRAPPGRIDVFVDRDNRLFSVEDNGVGLDLPDIRTFLSVIGATNKVIFQEQLTRKGRTARDDMIGQFGIGLLAAFIAAGQIALTTRKAGTKEAFQWWNDGSQTCRVFEATKPDVGTRVDVHIRDDPEYDFLLNERSVRDTVLKYMDFLPIPIYVNRGPAPVNTIRVPWDRSPDKDGSVEDREKLVRFINDRYQDLILDIIPFSFTEPHRAQGLLYFSSDRMPYNQTGGRMEVLVHRVCVTGQDTTFLPPWASFVSGIIDSPELNPNVARDNVVRDEVFVAVQNALGRRVVERLTQMSRDEPKKFATIADYHHFHLVGMAIRHDEFFDEVKDLLPFYTNRSDNEPRGSHDDPLPQLMSLRAYREHVGRDSTLGYKTPIYFTASGGSASQFNILANAQDLLILNTTRIFERDFLRKYADRYDSEVELVQLDKTIPDKLFKALSDSETEAIAPLLSDIASLLQQSGRTVRVEARIFRPDSLPSALIGEYVDDEEARREQVSAVIQVATGVELDVATRLSRIQTRSSALTLLVNYGNPIVRRLMAMDRRDRDRQSSLMAIYNGTFLKSVHLLGTHNASVIHQQFFGLLDANLDKRQVLDEARSKIAELQDEIKDLLDERMAASPKKSDRHIILFMMTPFGSEYDNVEAAMRAIFEDAPYFFEVRLARDYREDGFLHENVRRHIAMADGFIADVTQGNPNVLLEVGATLFTSDNRPKFCLRGKDASVEVPSDIRHVIRIEYASRSDDPLEIANTVRQQLAGAELDELLSRREERYLSKSLVRRVVEDVHWTSEKLAALRRHYRSVERLISATPEDIAATINVGVLIGRYVKKEFESLGNN